MKIEGCKYYDLSGAREIHGDDTPDVVGCRRLNDCPPGYAERKGGIIDWCVGCGQPVVVDPKNPHAGIKKVCLQCLGIRPDPIPEGE